MGEMLKPIGKELQARVENKKTLGYCVILTGPNGSGKGTIKDELLKNERLSISSLKRYTSRPQGEHEQTNEYEFVSKDAFLELVDQGFFIEWVQYGVTRATLYGTPKEPMVEKLRDGKNIILDMQTDEAILLRNALTQVGLLCIDIFVNPAETLDVEAISEVIERRMIERSRDELIDIRRRLSSIPWIVEQANNISHQVINKDGGLSEAIDQILLIIQHSLATGSFRSKRES